MTPRNRDIIFALKVINRAKPGLSSFSGDLRKAAREAQEAVKALGGVSAGFDRIGSSSARSGAQVGNATNNMRKALVTIQRQAQQTQSALQAAFAVQPGAKFQQASRRQSSAGSIQNARAPLTGRGPPGDDARQASSLKQGLDEAARSAGLLHKAIASVAAVVTAGFGVKKVLDAADTYTQLRGQLTLVTRSQEELNAVYERTFAIAQNTRQSVDGTASLYARLVKATENAGYSANQLLGVTETVNKALATTPGPAASAEAALLQLSQGLASGTLRGEELNSVMEQAPRLAKAIADGMGVPVGSLKRLAEQGKLTSDTIIKALMSQRATIDAEFAKLDKTASQAFTVLGNAMVDFIGRADKATGATNGFADNVIAFANRLNDPSLMAGAIRAFEVFGSVLSGLGNVFTAAITNVELVAAAMAVLATRMALIPFNALVSGAVQMGSALYAVATGAGVAATGFTALQLSLGVVGIALTALAGAFAYFSISGKKASATTNEVREALAKAAAEGKNMSDAVKGLSDAKRFKALTDIGVDLAKLEPQLKSTAEGIAKVFETAKARGSRFDIAAAFGDFDASMPAKALAPFQQAIDAFVASVRAGKPDAQAFVEELNRIGATSNDAAIQRNAQLLEKYVEGLVKTTEAIARARKEQEALNGLKPNLDTTPFVDGAKAIKAYADKLAELRKTGGDQREVQEATESVTKATALYEEGVSQLGKAFQSGKISGAEYNEKLAALRTALANSKDALLGVTEAQRELNKLQSQNRIDGMEDGRAKKLAELKQRYDELSESTKRSVHDPAQQARMLLELDKQRAVAIANIDAAYRNGVFKDRLQDLENERRLLGLTGEEREREVKRIEVENEARRAGVSDVTAQTNAYMQQYDALKKLTDQANQSFGAGFSNAIKSYVNETKNVTRESEKLWGGVFSKIEDGIVEVVTTGKLNFQNFLNGLAQDFARFASRQLLKGLFGFGDSSGSGDSNVFSQIAAGISKLFSNSSGGNSSSGGGNAVTSAASAAISKVFAPVTNDITAAAKAIRTIESGSAAGNYSALGPLTASGDRAYGAYQVMGNNVPSWTEKHYGESLTPSQFLSNRDAQDAVFKGQFGGYMDKYGPTGAAQAWFGGPGSVGKLGRQDVLGTSVGGYGGKFDQLYSANSSPLNYTTDMSKYTLDQSTIDKLNEQFGDVSNSVSGMAPSLKQLDTNLADTAAKVGTAGTDLNTGLQQASTATQAGGAQVGASLTTTAATTAAGGATVGAGLTTTAGQVAAGGVQIGTAMQTAAANIQASGASAGGGGGILSAIGSFFGGGGVGRDIVRLNHVGGIAGRASASIRHVNPRIFDDARRFHSGGIPGLKSNEEAIIAEKDEALLPTVRLPNGKFGVSAAGLGGGGGGPSIGEVTVNITMQGGATGNEQQDADQAKRIGKEVKSTFKGLMAEWTQNESRPGGALFKGV